MTLTKVTVEFDSIDEALARLTGAFVPAFVPTFPAVDDVKPEAAPRRRRSSKATDTAAPADQKVPPVQEPTTNTAAPASSESFDDDPPTASSFLDEDEEPAPAKKYNKNDVRAALVALQVKHGQQAAQTVLLDVGGTDKLGKLDESKFGAVVEAANKAAAA